MAAVSNDASLNALADGASVSSSNNGGGTNTLMTVTGSAPVERRTGITMPIGDTACYQWSARSANGYFLITASGFDATTGGACGAWIYFDTAPAPSNSQQIMRFGNTAAHGLTIAGSGKLSLIVNSANVFTTTTVLAASTWYWFSHASNSSSTAGQARLGLWDAAGSLIEQFASAATLNTSAITSGTSGIGKMNTLAGLPLYRIAAVRTNTDANALIPPVTTPPPTPPPPVTPTLQGWGIAA